MIKLQKLVNGEEWEVSRLDTFCLPYKVKYELQENEKFVFTVRAIDRPHYDREELGAILFQREIVDVKVEDGYSYFAILATRNEARAIPNGKHAWDLALICDGAEQEEALIKPKRFEVFEVLR